MAIVCSLVTLDLTRFTSINQKVCWTDHIHDVVSNGTIYRSAGSLLKISNISTQSVLNNKQIKITLSGLDENTTQIVNSNEFRNAPILIEKAILQDNTNNVSTKRTYFRGKTATPDTTIDYKSGLITINISAQSIFDLSVKPSYSRSNNATHQFSFNGDMFFEYANRDLGEDILWRKR
ncbi:DUF2163 domain-containing protein [Aeromonas rivipollensis]|uniref:DUF2163 domain-containing protein n=1 Tax=Aeromonas rivipollensis TaxID=948519 RepID=A0ABX0D609_9GAMM|nr:DUF2163 domain-containing protein [Aeromonas rivipollensis]NEX88900.1 DUF2163 domain-containing protein [Aeromonas rivipollensis]NEY04639.1 DUF2163 domain-containing protein [Aeromonas rivipollensis]